MNELANVALFDGDGVLLRLVSGSKAQVDLNVEKHDGPWAELPLEISVAKLVPSLETLRSQGVVHD